MRIDISKLLLKDFGDSRTVEDAKNPRYMNTYFNSILLDVKFKEFTDYVQFTAMPTDSEPWGRQLFADAEAGKYGPVKPPKPAPNPTVPKDQNPGVTSAKMLQKANAMLRENSHLVTPEIQALMEPESAAAARDYVKKLGEIIGKAQIAIENKEQYWVDLPSLQVKFKAGK